MVAREPVTHEGRTRSTGSRAAVLGHPVGHSLSPAVHRAAYRVLGLQGWSYDAVDLAEPDLPAWFAGLDSGWAGLSLTMPLKKAVLPLLTTVSPLAAAVGAVNTVTFGPGGPACGAQGHNTDVHGIVAALAGAGVGRAARVVILGGGATAASAVAAARDLGCRTPVLAVRTPQRAGPTLEAAARLGVSPVVRGLDEPIEDDVAGADVVISTLPAGAADPLADRWAHQVVRGSTAAVLLDVVYAPWPTALAAAWSAAGAPVVSGFEMLVHQAGAQVRLMTGLEAPLEAMRAAGLAQIARRAQESTATPSG